eukprot:4336285-Amphidinium_carterae.2
MHLRYLVLDPSLLVYAQSGSVLVPLPKFEGQTTGHSLPPDSWPTLFVLYLNGDRLTTNLSPRRFTLNPKTLKP